MFELSIFINLVMLLEFEFIVMWTLSLKNIESRIAATEHLLDDKARQLPEDAPHWADAYLRLLNFFGSREQLALAFTFRESTVTSSKREILRYEAETDFPSETSPMRAIAGQIEHLELERFILDFLEVRGWTPSSSAHGLHNFKFTEAKNRPPTLYREIVENLFNRLRKTEQVLGENQPKENYAGIRKSIMNVLKNDLCLGKRYYENKKGSLFYTTFENILKKSAKQHSSRRVRAKAPKM